MKSKKKAYKPRKPDAEIIRVLYMLATGETWDSVEDETYWSRSSIGVARAWFLSLNDEDASEYVSHYENRETILQWRTGQKLVKGGHRELQETGASEKAHLENIKDVIKWWRDNLAGLPFTDIIDLPQTLRFNAWGVVGSVSAGGGGSRVSPIWRNHELKDSLRGHLLPPAVDSDFWPRVGESAKLGLSLLGSVRSLWQKIEERAIKDTGQPFIRGDFHREPANGLTRWFARTIFERALGESTALYQGYLRLAVVYGNGGVVLTGQEEGLRLFYQQGWDRRIQTIWVREATDWIEPPDTAHRLLIGDGDWMSAPGVWPLRFVLCGGRYEIALTNTPEELAICHQAYRNMLADTGDSAEARAIHRMRTMLDLECGRITENLERALQLSAFPGRCARCPQQ